MEFKEELQAIVDTLRANGPLKDLASMNNYCHKNGGAITEDSRSFGYVAETDHYRYCLRCIPTPGDYQGYLYCYDKRQQEMAQKDKIVGRVTFADGTAQEFTDPHQYLQTIKEELPFRNTTGFKHETLSEDPEIKKAVDDILLDFAGEENPRRTCNYGLTEKGLQALRDVADPSLPHSYAWFVMTDCNTPQEQLHRNLTLDEAVELWYLPGGQLLRHQGDRTYADPGADSRPSPRGRGEGQKVQRGQRKETGYGSRKGKGPRIRHSKGSTHLAPRNSEVDPLQRTCASTDIPSERNS